MAKLLDQQKVEVQKWHLPDVKGAMTSMEQSQQVLNQSLKDNQAHALPQNTEKSGYLRGYEEGLLSGHEKAYHESKAKLDEQFKVEWVERLQLAEQLINVLQKPATLITQEVEQAILALISDLTTRLVRSELQSMPEQLISIITDAKDMLHLSDQPYTVRLHPNDLARLKEKLPVDSELKQHLIEDKILQRGDFHLSTDSSEIEGKITTRVDTLVENMVEE